MTMTSYVYQLHHDIVTESHATAPVRVPEILTLLVGITCGDGDGEGDGGRLATESLEGRDP